MAESIGGGGRMELRRICMNRRCGATATVEWKNGWRLRSDEFATLCFDCGSAYEKHAFCDTFHLDESGWRECSQCGMRLHCGCIASLTLLEPLDLGGIGCISCTEHPRNYAISKGEILNGFGTSMKVKRCDLPSKSIEDEIDGDHEKKKVMPLRNGTEKNKNHFFQAQNGDTKASNGQVTKDETKAFIKEIDTCLPSLTQHSIGSPEVGRHNCEAALATKDSYQLLTPPFLSMSLIGPSGNSTLLPCAHGGVNEQKEQMKAPSSSQQGQKPWNVLLKSLETNGGRSLGVEANKGPVPRKRVARPPAEGRGWNQLLPRYWPRITDQELQQLSGDLNSTIVPLFEKVLSASDASRIGRLVLPKACAEAYFPPISQSEGCPLRIQDAKGNEWTLQFRFWPNNNSRMYVLEGVTPCIQSMQLQAGDTVTFSRIDPEGKLVMGFRRTSSTEKLQDPQKSALTSIPPDDSNHRATLSTGVTENLPLMGVESSVHSLKRSSKAVEQNANIERSNLTDGDFDWCKRENLRVKGKEHPLPQKTQNVEKKRTRNIGSKSKRLLIHNEDAREHILTWEEAQDLLRPSPTCKPSIVVIEDYEFEEYDEPPVFGKRTIFTRRPSGINGLGVIVVPNGEGYQPKFFSLQVGIVRIMSGIQADFKKLRTRESLEQALECEPSGLDALANAAVLGDNMNCLAETSVGATTKHPRHRPGCTCIVCMQPPSGKGKHKSTCMCTLCMMVKRRFKTLQLRKSKHQSEHMDETSERQHMVEPNDQLQIESASGDALFHTGHVENERNKCDIQMDITESSKAQLDLNSHPNREEDLQVATTISMTSLVQAASLPLEMYLKQNGFVRLIDEQEHSLGGVCEVKNESEDDKG
ncbi:B3 DNA binding domain [Dillenia turbinata]|uniref:B3 DNA binding domain n=1 Tax=Dillenia turbinata TaxID=194707 RepID=A0AAN8VWW5_9MAGN